MNTNSRTFKEAQLCAKLTQRYYDHLNVAGTQNVRNPIPMRELVKKFLPVLPVGTVKYTCSMKLPGFSKEVEGVFSVEPETILGKDYLKKSAISARKLAELIRANGYLVNSMVVVHQALRATSGVGRVPIPRESNNGKGVQPKGYFLVAGEVRSCNPPVQI